MPPLGDMTDHGITPGRRTRLLKQDEEVHQGVLIDLYVVIVDIEDAVPHIWRECLH